MTGNFFLKTYQRTLTTLVSVVFVFCSQLASAGVQGEKVTQKQAVPKKLQIQANQTFVPESPVEEPTGPEVYRQAKTQKSVAEMRFKAVGKRGDVVMLKGTAVPVSRRGKIEEERQSEGVQVPDSLKGLVKTADNILDQIDKTTLDVLKWPLGLLGMKAEEATLRPSGGGVALGVKINLHPYQKVASKPSSDKNSKSLESLVKNKISQ